jgi:hypothetical protein
MPGVNGVQGTPKTIEVQEKSEAPVKTENSAPKAAVDTFEPGQARTAKGEAYLKLLERQKEEPGEARTAKGAAYLKWKEAQTEPGHARTAKGEAYLKMMKAEATEILRETSAVQPGDAPRVKKQSGKI